MQIQRILTNNAIVALDRFGKEQIVCGKGIGYKKRPGEEVDDHLVDKIFVKETDMRYQQIIRTLEHLPDEYLLLAYNILQAACAELNMKLNPIMLFSLADHLYYALQRFQEGVPLASGLSWEIKRFYEKEYQIGLLALELVQKQFGIQLPESEAAFVAMHIVSGETDDATMEEVFEITKITEDICTIVRVSFGVEMDTSSTYYDRFITHLKYFARRVLHSEQYNDPSSEDLAQIIFKKYSGSFRCANKIGEYLSKKYHYQLVADELMYLTIHIQTILTKGIKRGSDHTAIETEGE